MFHEGLKSWSCCKDQSSHRPVTSFDEFLALKGCTTGTHSSEPPEPVPKPASAADTAVPSSTDSDGKEVYGTVPAVAVPPPLPPAPASAVPPKDGTKPVSTTYEEEQDDPDVTLEKGTKFKRKACGNQYDGESRDDETCRYHAGVVSESGKWVRR